MAIDEAQYLVQKNPRGPDNWDALEWARELAEEGYFGLAFVGDLKLLDGLSDAPQLRRRTHPRVTLNHSTEEDISAFCQARGLTDRVIVQKLAKVAKRYGGLGDVSEVLTCARDMSNGAMPNSNDFLAAIEYLDFKMGGRP